MAQGTPALLTLARAHVQHVVHEYRLEPAQGARDGRPAYGREAAEALGVAPERMFKTLVAMVDDRLVLAIVPVSGELDLKHLADAVGGRRATMVEPATAERATGYVVGGISPLGSRRPLPAVLDTTATSFPTIYVSAGRRGLQVELAPGDLVRLTGATTAPIARI